jgi:hypothetical protein
LKLTLPTALSVVFRGAVCASAGTATAAAIVTASAGRIRRFSLRCVMCSFLAAIVAA